MSVHKPLICAGCGGLLNPESKTGFCRNTFECRSMANKAAAVPRNDADRACAGCKGPITALTRSDYCQRNLRCEKLSKRQLDRARRALKSGLVDEDDRARLTVAEFNILVEQRRTQVIEAQKARRGLNDWAIPDDGYVDDIAVDLVVSGKRRVRLTPTEREIAICKMLDLNLGFNEIKHTIGLDYKALMSKLNELGWEVINDPAGTGRGPRLIARIDRDKNKLLDGETCGLSPQPRVFAHA